VPLDIARLMVKSTAHQGFEELLTSSNQLNRKLEEVLGVGKEFQSVADLWGVSETSASRHVPTLTCDTAFPEI
jgi:hypothetical protein